MTLNIIKTNHKMNSYAMCKYCCMLFLTYVVYLYSITSPHVIETLATNEQTHMRTECARKEYKYMREVCILRINLLRVMMNIIICFGELGISKL